MNKITSSHRKPSQKSSIRVTKSKEVRESVEEDECEDPDKLTSRGQGNCELTQCPAYEAAEMDDVHEDTDHEGNCELTQCPAYEATEVDDVHEDTDHEGNCELTQCPAYESTEVDDVHEDTGHEGNCELTQCPAYEATEVDHNNL